MHRSRKGTLAQWATKRQLRQAGLFASEGLILGRAYGRLLRHNGPEHVLVVASTQSGKTGRFVYPNLLTWRQSVIIHDPKTELFPETAGWRSTFSRVVHLAPASSLSQCYNPLDAIAEALGTDQEMRRVQLVSEMFVDPDGRGASHMSDAEKHFQGMAQIACNGLLLYGLYTQRARSLGAVRALYLRTPLADLAAAMTRYPYPPIQEAGRVLAQTDGKNERSGIFSTTARALWLYGDRLIQRATDRSDFTLRDLRERVRPCSVYLSIPFGDQERLRPWTRLLLRQFCDYCVSRKEGWTWKMLGMIDEVPGLRRINIIPDGLNYFAGYGVRLALITPSMQELGGTYGQHHNFLEGCQGKVIFGMEDHAVAEVFSKRIGDTAVTKRRKVGRQWMTEQVTEPLLSPTALTNLAKDRQVVIVGRQKIIARKTYYKDNAVWAARSQL